MNELTSSSWPWLYHSQIEQLLPLNFNSYSFKLNHQEIIRDQEIYYLEGKKSHIYSRSVCLVYSNRDTLIFSFNEDSTGVGL